MKFRYTILYVDDVAASLDFFERAFGFERAFLHESGDYGELATGSTKLAFSSTELMRRLEKKPAAPRRDAPTFEIAFETDDVATALKKAVDAGALLVQDVRDEPCHHGGKDSGDGFAKSAVSSPATSGRNSYRLR